MGLYARDSRSRLSGVREFESHPLHHYGKIVRGFVLATLVLVFSENLVTFEIAHVFKSRVYEGASIRLAFGYS